MEIVVFYDTSIFMKEADKHQPKISKAINEYYDRCWVWHCVTNNLGDALWNNIRIKGMKASIAWRKFNAS